MKPSNMLMFNCGYLYSFYTVSLMMMEQGKQGNFSEKALTLLHKAYADALKLLKQRSLPQGVASLIKILQHPAIQDSDLDSLRYSTFMSLAEVHEVMNDSVTSLGFFWQALQILQKRRFVQKGEISMNDEKSGEEFTLVVKMVLLAQKLDYVDEQMYLLKKAIKLSPSLWRQGLLLKLQVLYKKTNKQECLKDLQNLLANKDRLQYFLSEHSQPIYNTELLPSQLRSNQLESNHIAKITVIINLHQKDDIYLKYSNWEVLLTISYIFLKAQNQRNFNKKKYLHKKYDQNNHQWNQFVKEFSPINTKIHLLFLNREQQPERIEVEGQSEPQWGKIVADLANDLLKNKYLKKKVKKRLNPLQELTRQPSLNSKDPKKVITAQTKSIYTSLTEYYRETMSKGRFNKAMLENLRPLGEGPFQQLFGGIIKDQVQLERRKNSDEEESLQASSSVVSGVIGNQNDPSKEKKSLKVKKMEIINSHRQLSLYIPQLLCTEGNSEIQFRNICQMIEEITAKLTVDKDNSNDMRTAILGDKNIRYILQKDILKVIQKGEGFFNDQINTGLLDLLLEKLEQLVEKDPKSKMFKLHQETKQEHLVSFIKTYFMPSIYSIQQALATEIKPSELKRFSHICLSFVRLNSLYGMVNLTQISHYRDLYIIFKRKEGDSEKRATSFIDKEIQKYQQKVNERIQRMAMGEEKEEDLNSVDDIYKKDPEISAVLPLLRIFNCHPEQQKTKSSECQEQMTQGLTYLETFIKLSSLFFIKVELESVKQFNSRLLALLSDIMKIKLVINELYNKITQGSAFKTTEIDPQIYSKVLFYLLRFYLLSLPQDNDTSLKTAFILCGALLRHQSEEAKYLMVPKLICMFDEFIQFKKTKNQLTFTTRKRFYQLFIIKNIHYIYHSPYFQIDQDYKQNKKSKKRSRSRSQSPEGAMVPQKTPGVIKQQEVRDRVFDILHDVYFCPEKEKQFTPKKVEEAVAYFMYLLRAYHEMFQQQVIELASDALKVFKKCYRLFQDRNSQIFQFCNPFKSFVGALRSQLDSQDMFNRQQFISIIKGQRPSCLCGCDLKKTHSFYVQTLFVLGKFFQGQLVQPEQSLSKQNWNEEINYDEDYFYDYLGLNLEKQSAWQNLIRVKCTKTFFYFDSILHKPFDQFKQKFFQAKKILHFVLDLFPNSTVASYGLANLEMLNLLKIKQREYLLLQKEIQINGQSNKGFRELQRKYVQGMRKVLSSGSQRQTEDLRVRYLRWSQLKCKLAWHDLLKEQKSKDLPITIQLDQDPIESKAVHPPSKNVQELILLVQEAKGMLSDIPLQAAEDHLTHLEQDIVMELYVLLSKTLEWKIDNIITHICQFIEVKIPQRTQQPKKVLILLSDLDFILKLFHSDPFITQNPKYKLQSQSLMPSQTDISSLEAIFSTIFVTETFLKEERAIRQQEIIIIDDEADDDRQRMLEELAAQQSKNSQSPRSVKEKNLPKTQQVTLDLGTYIHNRVSSYIVKKNLLNCPLNQLQSILLSPYFLQIVSKTAKILNQVIRVAIQLPKYQPKRYKNRRSVAMTLLYCAHLTVTFSGGSLKANQLIKDFYTFKTDEFTTINLHNDKLDAQKNGLLSNFYNRVLVHNIMRIQFIRGVLNIFQNNNNKEAILTLNRKLLKIIKANQIKVDKPNKQENRPPEVSILVPPPQDLKQPKEGKEGTQKDLQSITLFNLFCLGSLKLTEIMQRESQVKEIEEKYEKGLKQFRNRIKRKAGDEKNYYLEKVQLFLTSYQDKYQKVIRLKKTKKEKEAEQIQPPLENPIDPPQLPVFIQPIIEIPQFKEPIQFKSEVKNSPQRQVDKNDMIRNLIQKIEKAKSTSKKVVEQKGEKQKKEEDLNPFIIIEGHRKRPIEIRQEQVEDASKLKAETKIKALKQKIVRQKRQKKKPLQTPKQDK